MALSNRSRIVLLLLVAGGVWWWWSHRAAPLVNAPAPAGPIVALGDSLTSGAGAEPDHNYVALLSKRIGRPVINSGVPGDTVADAAARLDRDVLDHKPGLVIVLLGGNDMLRGENLDESFAGLEQVIRGIQATGAMVTLVGLQGLSPIGGVAGRYKELARQTGCVFVPDILDGVLGDPKLMSDGVHPNSDGYTIIADRIAAAIGPWLPPQE